MLKEKKKSLVYAYQILSYLQLDDHTYTLLSVISEDQESFYIYPFGMRFNEISVNLLMKVSFDGDVIDGKEYQYNKTCYIIHGSIYKAREDVQAIFHLHTPSIVAVSAMKEGLLPISQWALHFYNKISYYDYNSLAIDNVEGKELATNLSENFVMLMRNHGSITCGKTSRINVLHVPPGASM